MPDSKLVKRYWGKVSSKLMVDLENKFCNKGSSKIERVYNGF